MNRIFGKSLTCREREDLDREHSIQVLTKTRNINKGGGGEGNPLLIVPMQYAFSGILHMDNFS